MTFSSAVSDGTRWKDWNTKPTRSARSFARPSSSSAVKSAPARVMCPEVGVSSPASSASSVDLPAPDAPMMATDSPAAMSNDTSFTMVSIPSGLVTFFVRFAALSTLIRFAWLLCFFAFTGVAGAAGSAPRTVVVLGDSLSAGYGIRLQEGCVQLLGQRLADQGYEYHVVNASVSGETTLGGLARLPRVLETHKPAIVIVELGGNDGLRGLPLATSRENLKRIIELARKSNARVVLVGMVIPPNYGPRYGQEFR